MGAFSSCISFTSVAYSFRVAPCKYDNPFYTIHKTRTRMIRSFWPVFLMNNFSTLKRWLWLHQAKSILNRIEQNCDEEIRILQLFATQNVLETCFMYGKKFNFYINTVYQRECENVGKTLHGKWGFVQFLRTFCERSVSRLTIVERSMEHFEYRNELFHRVMVQEIIALLLA